MPRRRFVWDDKLKKLVEVSTDYRQPSTDLYVIPDTPDYVSPVTGLLVSGRKQRREDLKRTGSRPYEGFAQEKQEALRRQAYIDQRHDQKLEHATRTAYHQMSPEKRRILEGR
jgi:hypothetical protein